MKFRYKVTAAAVIACMIELLAFHSGELAFALNRQTAKNLEISSTDMEYLNWKKENGIWVSETDPQIFISPRTYVETLEVSLELNREIPFIVIYYKTDLSQEFNDAQMVFTEQVEKNNRFTIQKPVAEIRIDLGDDAGVGIQDIRITLNPLSFQFSFARVIAMILIYVAATGLFQISKSPNYFLKKENDAR